ncbi:collagen-binding protein [Bacteroidia bacterium]|nr:collagen-binding protein [Bacteroidia bacterium]
MLTDFNDDIFSIRRIFLLVALFACTQPAVAQWNTDDRQLEGVVVRKTKEKYSKKDNPAVKLMEEVIKRRGMHDPRDHDFYTCENYVQRSFARDNFTVEEAQSNWVYRKMDNLRDFIDTVSVAGRPLLPLYSEERVEKIYYRRSPHSEKRVLEALNRGGMIDFLSEEGTTKFQEEVFREIDLFQDNVPLLLQRFVSPLATFGPLYYKYYLLDTVVVNDVRCVDVGFAPFNSESFGFAGHLYVTVDSTFFIQKASFTTPRHINLNFVNSLRVEQEYARTSDSTRLLTKNDIVVDFNIINNGKGIYAHYLSERRNHTFEPPDDLKIFEAKAPVVEQADARSQPEDFWAAKRAADAKKKSATAAELMQALRKKPFFYYSLRAIDVLFNGYVPLVGDSARFEMGPINTFISGNSLEGLRLRVGGTTSVHLSRQLFADGYLAYGVGDERWKGRLLLEYTFEKRKKYRLEYPFHYLRAEYRYDINQIGQHGSHDNLFAMIVRKPNRMLTYMRTAALSYFHEHYNGWSYGITARHRTEWATPFVPFFDDFKAYKTAELEFKLRWAHNEAFYQWRNHRTLISMDATVIELTHTAALKDVLGSDYQYNSTKLSVRKRFRISPLGYVDVHGRAGKIWGEVPHTLLFMPSTNLSYTINWSESFSLLDPMEFLNRRFASWDVQYHLNGTLFNRIPLLNRLKWRELVACQGWYGDAMGNTPYMELTVGIENILRILRVDYVRRLTYRNRPDVPNEGVRVGAVLTF